MIPCNTMINALPITQAISQGHQVHFFDILELIFLRITDFCFVVTSLTRCLSCISIDLACRYLSLTESRFVSCRICFACFLKPSYNRKALHCQYDNNSDGFLLPPSGIELGTFGMCGTHRLEQRIRPLS